MKPARRTFSTSDYNELFRQYSVLLDERNYDIQLKMELINFFVSAETENMEESPRTLALFDFFNTCETKAFSESDFDSDTSTDQEDQTQNNYNFELEDSSSEDYISQTLRTNKRSDMSDDEDYDFDDMFDE